MPTNRKIKIAFKIKLRRGDNVKVIAGKDKKKQGKVLMVDRKRNRVVVEGINMIKKHEKPNRQRQQGGIIQKEAPIHASNVVYMHNGKPTKIGFKIATVKDKGEDVKIKQRIARSTGEVID
ncbi:MAG: 50S ribosomal protein L24 [Defluviitaleaceae bacterium]|nr:50S ribosomal protein L24 [Defluviitaleaceae bacterium]